MNRMEPIRDTENIKEIKEDLLKQSYRNYMMFLVGINTGLRVSDLLRLKVDDIRDKKHIIVKEQKTSKYKQFLINKVLRKELNEYMKNMDNDEYLFQSRIGKNKPLSRFQAYRIISTAGRKAGLERIGCNSTRKTFGYHHYKKYKDVALLQKLFNHSEPAITLCYIGITQDILDDSIENFSL
ncbi:phage integrase family protein [Halanaerobium saccharolyticum]|uniref:Phage integrase family protein n=1 Tax=Halanaerobium saccharolyticum TaxID=43595 RepID=A0A2T5RFA4_9FIRM|nr:site-specific integrase [Halanaerobium saccharolyticum]PTV93022.1 phage integrase family protein [Halanaerobium saccharolyticum]